MPLTVFRNQVRFAVQNCVHTVVAEVEKERFVLVATNEVGGFGIHSIDQKFIGLPSVFLNIDPSNRLFAKDVGPEIRAISNSLQLPGKVPLKTVHPWRDFVFCRMVFVAGEVPLSDHACRISVFSKQGRQRGV